MELNSNKVIALIEPRKRDIGTYPITANDNVIVVEEFGLDCKVDSVCQDTVALTESINALIRTALKGGQSTMLLSCVGNYGDNSRQNTVVLFFTRLKEMMAIDMSLDYAYLSFVDEYFYDLRKSQKRYHNEFFEKGFNYFYSPAESIESIEDVVKVDSMFPFMLQIRFKNTLTGSITLMDMLHTSYRFFGVRPRDKNLTTSFEKLRKAIKASADPKYKGIYPTDENILTYILQDFISGRSNTLTILYFEKFSNVDQVNLEGAFEFIRDCMNIKSRVVYKTEKITGKLYTNYKALKNNYNTLKEHYEESRRRHQATIDHMQNKDNKVKTSMEVASLVTRLNANTEKVNLLFEYDNQRRSRLEQLRSQHESFTQQCELKDEIMKLKKENKRLARADEESKRFDEFYQRFQNQFMTLQNAYKKAEDDKQLLQKSNEELQDTNKSLLVTYHSMHNKEVQCYVATEENKKLKFLSEAMKKTIKNVNKENDELRNRINRLRRDLTKLNSEFNSTNQRSIQINGAYTRLKDQFKELQNKNDDLQKRLEERARIQMKPTATHYEDFDISNDSSGSDIDNTCAQFQS